MGYLGRGVDQGVVREGDFLSGLVGEASGNYCVVGPWREIQVSYRDNERRAEKQTGSVNVKKAEDLQYFVDIIETKSE